jgi:hypothetical protein
LIVLNDGMTACSCDALTRPLVRLLAYQAITAR